MSVPQLDSIISRFSEMKSTWGESVSLHRMRNDLDDFYASFPAPGEVDFEAVDAGGTPAEWVTAASARTANVVLYFHGGGFAVGSLRASRNYAAHLSVATRARVLVLGYRLAPEHRFPAQIDDAEAAYRWLRSEGYAPGKIALQGDSAGACLALSLLVRLREARAPLPSAAALLTPWADLRCGAASYDTLKDRDPVASREIALMMATTYLGESDKATDPRANPMLADLSGICPLLVHTAGRDVFRDDGRAIAARATEKGVSVEAEESPAMIHQWHLYAAELDEARAALGSVSGFYARHWSD